MYFNLPWRWWRHDLSLHGVIAGWFQERYVEDWVDLHGWGKNQLIGVSANDLVDGEGC